MYSITRLSVHAIVTSRLLRAFGSGCLLRQTESMRRQEASPNEKNEPEYHADRDHYTERGNHSGSNADEIPSGLSERVAHGMHAGMLGDDRIRLVDRDSERAHRGTRAQIAHSSLVAFDLLTDARELTFHAQDVGELAGAIREELDQPLLEAARVDHPCLHVDELLADVLHRDVD